MAYYIAANPPIQKKIFRQEKIVLPQCRNFFAKLAEKILHLWCRNMFFKTNKFNK